MNAYSIVRVRCNPLFACYRRSVLSGSIYLENPGGHFSVTPEIPLYTLQVSTEMLWNKKESACLIASARICSFMICQIIITLGFSEK